MVPTWSAPHGRHSTVPTLRQLHNGCCPAPPPPMLVSSGPSWRPSPPPPIAARWSAVSTPVTTATAGSTPKAPTALPSSVDQSCRTSLVDCAVDATATHCAVYQSGLSTRGAVDPLAERGKCVTAFWPLPADVA